MVVSNFQATMPMRARLYKVFPLFSELCIDYLLWMS